MAVKEKLSYFDYLYLIPLFLFITILTITAAISSVIFVVAYLISCCFSSYGNFISYSDTLTDENFEDSVPRNSLVFSSTLQGNISLEELRAVFTQNVLNARSKVNPSELRYPKLKQYLTMLIGFRIWKKDPNFQIQNYIVEKNWNGAVIADIHQTYLNKPYQKERSPWDLTLIRNVNFTNDSLKGPVSFLVLRMHHVMGDGGSLLKLIVGCLGNKQLKTANPQYIQETYWDYLKFISSYPYKYIYENIRIIRMLNQSFGHPWILANSFKNSTSPTIVAFSSKILMSNLKKVAKENRVKVSAVVTSIIAGAIRNICGKEWDKEVAIGYVLPKPNHPESLSNHALLSFLSLPTNQPCGFKRLHKCNQELEQIKDEQRGRYSVATVLLAGLQIYPINRIFENMTPTGITNVAGEEEGFSIGNTNCIDFHITVGSQRGPLGVLFCASSYKDEMRIAVIGKESILSKETAEKLAKNIELELKSLLETTE